jgi:hypothetical protein
MLPFILGGVALAVTGYGMAKLFEDDVPCLKSSIDSYSQSDSTDVMDRFEDVKSKLCEVTLKELQTAFNEIKNLEKDIEISICKPIENQYNFLTLNDDVQDVLDKYITMLEDTQSFIDIQLDKLDELIMKSNDYETYSDEEKEFVQKLIDLNNIIVETTQSKITLDGETIARDVKRAFGKIEVVLKNERID